MPGMEGPNIVGSDGMPGPTISLVGIEVQVVQVVQVEQAGHVVQVEQAAPGLQGQIRTPAWRHSHMSSPCSCGSSAP